MRVIDVFFMNHIHAELHNLVVPAFGNIKAKSRPVQKFQMFPERFRFRKARVSSAQNKRDERRRSNVILRQPSSDMNGYSIGFKAVCGQNMQTDVAHI